MSADQPQQSREALMDLVVNIVQALGAPWKKDEPRTRNTTPGLYEPPDCGYIQGAGDERFRIHYASDSRTGVKLYVSGIYPGTARGEYIGAENAPGIQCAVSRGPEAIARDILRRFLPGYRTALAQVLKDKQSTDEYQSRQRDNTSALAKLFGKTLTEDELNNGSFWLRQVHGNVHVSAKTVRFDALDVPMEAALKIAEIIAQIKGR